MAAAVSLGCPITQILGSSAFLLQENVCLQFVLIWTLFLKLVFHEVSLLCLSLEYFLKKEWRLKELQQCDHAVFPAGLPHVFAWVEFEESTLTPEHFPSLHGHPYCSGGIRSTGMATTSLIMAQ